MGERHNLQTNKGIDLSLSPFENVDTLRQERVTYANSFWGVSGPGVRSVSLCDPGSPGTCHVAQSGLYLTILQLSQFAFCCHDIISETTELTGKQILFVAVLEARKPKVVVLAAYEDLLAMTLSQAEQEKARQCGREKERETETGKLTQRKRPHTPSIRNLQLDLVSHDDNPRMWETRA